MDSAILQPARADDVKDWVWISDNDDEPAIYESNTPHTPSSPTEPADGTDKNHNQQHPIDILFRSTAPVEEPLSNGDAEEQQYFGDEDIIEDRIPPERAFEVFLATNYPISSTSINPAVHASRNSIQQRQQLSSESRAERLSRLTFEVNQLASDVGASAEEESFNALSQIEQLKQQLAAIEQCTTTSTIVKPFVSMENGAGEEAANQSLDVSEPQPSTEHHETDQPKMSLKKTTLTTTTTMTSTTVETEETKERSGNKHQPQKHITVQMVSPTVATVTELEQRITRLEQSVGLSSLENNFDGTSIAQTLEDVRMRLTLATDSSLSKRLCEDAKHIAQILSADVSPQRLDESIRLGTLLDKLHHWQPVIDAIPLLVDRFASVRRLHEEASHFVDAAAALSKHLDSVESRTVTNRTLLNTVKRTMQENMNNVNENLTILNEKLQPKGQERAT